VYAEKPKAPKAPGAKKTTRAAKGHITVIRNNHKLIIDPSKVPNVPKGLDVQAERAWAWDNLTPSQYGMWATLAWEKRRVAEGRPVEARNPKLGPPLTVWL
jgi:hypothetical protein